MEMISSLYVRQQLTSINERRRKVILWLFDRTGSRKFRASIFWKKVWFFHFWIFLLHRCPSSVQHKSIAVSGDWKKGSRGQGHVPTFVS